MTLVALSATMVNMKMIIRSFFVPLVLYQHINLVTDLKLYLRMIGFATIVSLLGSKED